MTLCDELNKLFDEIHLVKELYKYYTHSFTFSISVSKRPSRYNAILVKNENDVKYINISDYKNRIVDMWYDDNYLFVVCDNNCNSLLLSDKSLLYKYQIIYSQVVLLLRTHIVKQIYNILHRNNDTIIYERSHNGEYKKSIVFYDMISNKEIPNTIHKQLLYSKTSLHITKINNRTFYIIINSGEFLLISINLLMSDTIKKIYENTNIKNYLIFKNIIIIALLGGVKKIVNLDKYTCDFKICL